MPNRKKSNSFSFSQLFSFTQKEIVLLVGMFVAWRALLFLVGALADTWLTYAPSFPYADYVLVHYDLPRWLYSWANFDGVHYLTIAEKGYIGTGLIQAFFPLYPYVILHALFLLVGGHLNTLLTGLIVSNSFSLALLLLWFSFVKKHWSAGVAWGSTISLLLFPTSFFLGALYTESVFLFLVVLAFWAAEQKKWWLAGVVTALASATRIVGIFLVPALVVELLWHHRQKGSKSWTQILMEQKNSLAWVLLGSSGLILYMLYLWYNFHDPLYFLHVQQEFGGGRQETLVLYPQVVWRYIKIFVSFFLSKQPFTWAYFAYAQEFVVGTIGFLALLCSFRWVKPSYVLFALGAFLLPTLTGTFSSVPRYFLVCVPIYLLMGEFIHKHRKLGILLLLLSGLLLLINTVLFIQGYWVA